jgi:hypothetical protein
MTDKERRFWEACGFKFAQPVEGGAYDVLYPDGTLTLCPSECLPDINSLDDLMKYAVPKVSDNHQELTVIKLIPTLSSGWASSIDIQGQPKARAFGKTPALALYEALCKSLEVE